MIEERKQKEIEYYNKKAEGLLKQYSVEKKEVDFEGFNPALLSSYVFFRESAIKKCQGKKVLDYGCGNGIHSVFPAKYGAEKVIGIDLSEKSLEIARKRIKREGLEAKVEFVLMDCEKMDFPENSFDIILDAGTFSSLDIKKALPELSRVLKPDGFLIGIETFGHNPFTNLKRSINKMTGKRTAWAASHILRMEDLRSAGDYFSRIEVHFFHLVSWLAFPFLYWPGGKTFLKTLESIDKMLLRVSFLKKYAFKAVFVFSEPKR